MEPPAKEEGHSYRPSAEPVGERGPGIEIGEITAWRIWRFGKDGIVYSPIINVPWWSGEVMRASPRARADDGIYGRLRAGSVTCCAKRVW